MFTYPMFLLTPEPPILPFSFSLYSRLPNSNLHYPIISFLFDSAFLSDFLCIIPHLLLFHTLLASGLILRLLPHHPTIVIPRNTSIFLVPSTSLARSSFTHPPLPPLFLSFPLLPCSLPSLPQFSPFSPFLSRFAPLPPCLCSLQSPCYLSCDPQLHPFTVLSAANFQIYQSLFSLAILVVFFGPLPPLLSSLSLPYSSWPARR